MIQNERDPQYATNKPTNKPTNKRGQQVVNFL